MSIVIWAQDKISFVILPPQPSVGLMFLSGILYPQGLVLAQKQYTIAYERSGHLPFPPPIYLEMAETPFRKAKGNMYNVNIRCYCKSFFKDNHLSLHSRGTAVIQFFFSLQPGYVLVYLS